MIKALRAHEAALAARRQALVELSSLQRRQWQALAQEASTGFEVADRVAKGLDWAREHLLMVGLVAGLLLAWRGPRQGLALAMRAWSLWKGAQGLRERLKTLLDRWRETGAAAEPAQKRPPAAR